MIARTISRWLTPPVSPWRVILLATLPFWAYLTLHDIIIYESYVLGGTPREMIASPMVRALRARQPCGCCRRSISVAAVEAPVVDNFQLH